MQQRSLVEPKSIESQNPFYITNNSSYGTAWQSAGNQLHGALNNDDVPQYRAVVRLISHINILLRFRVIVNLLSKTLNGHLSTLLSKRCEKRVSLTLLFTLKSNSRRRRSRRMTLSLRVSQRRPTKSNTLNMH